MITIPGAIYGIKTVFSDYSLISGEAVYISAIYDITLMTFIFAIFGLVAGAVISMTYNFISLVFGGIEIELIGDEIIIEEKPEDNLLGYE